RVARRVQRGWCLPAATQGCERRRTTPILTDRGYHWLPASRTGPVASGARALEELEDVRFEIRRTLLRHEVAHVGEFDHGSVGQRLPPPGEVRRPERRIAHPPEEQRRPATESLAPTPQSVVPTG